MGKLHLVGLALVAVVAFSAVVASSAFAEELVFVGAKFLIGANEIKVGEKGLAEGELLLEVVPPKLSVVCSGMFNGTYESGTDFLVTEVLDLSGKTFDNGLSGAGILCTAEKGCAASTEASPIEVWPLNLPWLWEPMLDMQTGKPWLLIFGTGNGAPGYEILCLVVGITFSEICNASEGSGNEVVNVATGIETEVGVSVTPNGDCVTGGAESGAIETATAGLFTAQAGVVSVTTP